MENQREENNNVDTSNQHIFYDHFFYYITPPNGAPTIHDYHVDNIRPRSLLEDFGRLINAAVNLNNTTTDRERNVIIMKRIFMEHREIGCRLCENYHNLLDELGDYRENLSELFLELVGPHFSRHSVCGVYRSLVDISSTDDTLRKYFPDITDEIAKKILFALNLRFFDISQVDNFTPHLTNVVIHLIENDQIDPRSVLNMSGVDLYQIDPYISDNKEKKDVSKEEAFETVKVDDYNDDNCVICLLMLKDRSSYGGEINNCVKSKCGHIFHDKCMDEYIKDSHVCPVCRTEF